MNLPPITTTADHETIGTPALEAFAAAIAAVDSGQALANVADAQKVFDRIAAAERAGNDRLDQIIHDLRKQPEQTADEVAAALKAGEDLAVLTAPRDTLNAEGDQVRAGLANLARERREVQRKLEFAREVARRPFATEANKLVDAIVDTAREHLAGLLACYAAASSIVSAADLRGHNRMLDGMKDILARAQVRDAGLAGTSSSPVDVPADALEAMTALANLGSPFDFAAISRVVRP